MMAIVAGAQVTPSVRLLRPLGEGGMGSVWVAEHLTLRTEVVVKFMSSDLARDPSNIGRFSREAAAAAAVKTPHVVQMLDHGTTEDGTPFIMMELLAGEDLRHHLRRRRVVAPRELALVVAQVCKALSGAHAAGVVHRDIKPDNIFLCQGSDDEVFVKLLDFGVAKTSGAGGLDNGTKTGSVVGTPYYMSPEQLLAERTIDFRTDLWSLGIVVFEALTGSLPFDAPTIGALAIAVTHGELPIPTQKNPSLPAGLDGWFRRACARKREDRFASAKEMSDSFQLAAGITPAASPADVSPLGDTVDASLGALGMSDTLLAPPASPLWGSAPVPAPQPVVVSPQADNARSLRAVLIAVALVMTVGTALVAYLAMWPQGDDHGHTGPPGSAP
jgi:eukaryotic-like serine/threonine-protein kinase